MNRSIGWIALTALLGGVACRSSIGQDSGESAALGEAAREQSVGQLAELIQGSDRIVVGQVIELIHVAQIWPIAPSRDWDAVVGTGFHGVGQDIEVAILRVEAPIVAPSEVTSMAVLGRFTPSDRHSTLKEGQRMLLFLENPKAPTGFSGGTHKALRDAVNGKEIWRIKPAAAWEVDSLGQLIATDALRLGLGNPRDPVPLTAAVKVIRALAKTGLPRCELGWSSGGIPAIGWSAFLEPAGDMHEFRGYPLYQTDSTEIPRGSDSVRWNADESGRAFRTLVATAGEVHTHYLGGRGMHSPALVFRIRTMRGSLFIHLALPFDNFEGRSAEEQRLAAACMEFLRELRFNELPEAAERALHD